VKRYDFFDITIMSCESGGRGVFEGAESKNDACFCWEPVLFAVGRAERGYCPLLEVKETLKSDFP